jgi:hypothetical protein
MTDKKKETETINETECQISRMEQLAKNYRYMLLCYVALITFPFIFVFALIPFVGFLSYAGLTYNRGKRLGKLIKQGEEGIKDDGYIIPARVVPVILLLTVITFIPTLMNAMNSYMYNRPDRRLSDYKKALVDYRENNEGAFPDANKWCDILAENETFDAYAFKGYNSKEKFCPYALNSEAERLGADAPADMVLLFPTEPGWNKTGGRELFRDGWGDWSTIMFADLEMRSVHDSDVPNLRWSVGDDVLPVKSYIKQLLIAFTSILGAAACWFLVKFGKYFCKFKLLLIITVLLGAGVGMLMGLWAESMLYAFREKIGYGWFIGGVAGFMTGLFYVLLLGRKLAENKGQIMIGGYATFYGIVAGMICSTIVHIYLSIFYEHLYIGSLFVGSGFGTFAGIILGWICGVLIRDIYYRDESGEERVNESS